MKPKTKSTKDNLKVPQYLEVHPKYPKMFYVKWEDGTRSEDFYNRPRANDIYHNPDDYADRERKSKEMFGNKRRLLCFGRALDRLK